MRAKYGTRFGDAFELLCDLIRIPSFSREEQGTADILETWLAAKGHTPRRKGNNIWVKREDFDASRPTVMLCSHHDTVRPVSTWTENPFAPFYSDGKLCGLGSNDAGASLACMSVAFDALQQRMLPFNLILALTAEEEIAGEGGIRLLQDELPPVDLAIVGEPTSLRMAIAERGLMVLDCTAHGISGHAGRGDGTNAITLALEQVRWFQEYEFEKSSPALGDILMSVTQINAGTQHNVIPDRCTYVVDVRVTDAYTHEELLDIIRSHVDADVVPRSTRLRPSAISLDHPVVLAAQRCGIETYASPTMSDQALLSVPSVKLGPGRSSRSHTADEFVTADELENGIETYLRLLDEYAEIMQ
ncbi:M20/M25/M40 family metallo-hydrolase [bacterium]|nr:M20/M25/M40 family metallo-hydrolase [bacterium]